MPIAYHKKRKLVLMNPGGNGKLYEVGISEEGDKMVVMVTEGLDDFGPVPAEMVGRHIQYWVQRGEPGWVEPEKEGDVDTEEQGEPG